jgi:hypothetical protein
LKTLTQFDFFCDGVKPVKTIRVSKIFDSAKLHTELQAGGISVVTVRASSPDAVGPAFCGVVVVQDSADVKKVQSMISSHKESRVPSRQIDAKQMEAALREMEKL